MRKAQIPPVSHDDRMSDSLRLMIGEALDHLDAHHDDARAGDMEAIHQMRVALRRLRSILKMLRRSLDPVSRDGFDDALRRLGRSLGAARDWDVFIEETLPAIREADPAGSSALDALVAPAARQRELAHQDLREALDNPMADLVLQDLRLWSDSASAFFPPRAADRLLRKQASQLLDRLANRAINRGHDLADQSDEERHDLRKGLKALRYGLQMLEALYAEPDVKPYRKALAALQEDLGALNDAIAATELADQLPESAAQAVIWRWAYTKKQAALAALPASWDHFKAMPPFWAEAER